MVIIGESGVGKTALMNKYVLKKYTQRYKATIGVDFLTKEIRIDDQILVLQIWDTAGQERFQSLGVAFYRGADAFIIVYDVTDDRSFNKVPEHLTESFIKSSIEKEGFPVLLLANKCDLLSDGYPLRMKLSNCNCDPKIVVELLVFGYCRKFEKIYEDFVIPIDIVHYIHRYCGNLSKGEIFAENNGMMFYQTSAKTGYNVDKSFVEIAKKGYDYQMKQNEKLAIHDVISPPWPIPEQETKVVWCC